MATPTFRVNARQKQLYTYRCALYAKKGGEVTGRGRTTDHYYGPLPDWSPVPCYRTDSLEDNAPQIIGRGQGDLVINLTAFSIVYGQPCEDGWLLRLFLPNDIGDPHNNKPPAYRNYIVQGSPRRTPAQGRRDVNAARLFAFECGQVETLENGNLVAPEITVVSLV